MKKGWKKGWLCRDEPGTMGVGLTGAYIVFFDRRPRMGPAGLWEPKPGRVEVQPAWTPQYFGREYKCNFPFPAKGSIHRVEMEF